jgi:glutamine amidotransferase
MKVAIIKSSSGNVRSVANAVRRLGVDPTLTENPVELASADRVIFPGVGEASTAMSYLRHRRLDTAIRSLSQPVLAICLGMQLLCEYSEEGNTDGLGIFPYKVRRFMGTQLKVPHVGWNKIENLRNAALFHDVTDGERMYFVHSYFVPRVGETTAESDYGEPFSAAIVRDNFYGVQFHPEKSGRVGAEILRNFLTL